METIYQKIRRGEFLFRLSDIDSFNSKIDKSSSCWNWHKDNRGYGRVSMRSVASLLAHVVSYLLHRDVIPDGLHVLHSCDNRSCVNPNHLWLGTHIQNMRDRDSKGRGAIPNRKGVQVNFAKLDDNKVIEIRDCVRLGASQQQMATRFNVAVSTISAIINNKTWKHI